MILNHLISLGHSFVQGLQRDSYLLLWPPLSGVKLPDLPQLQIPIAPLNAKKMPTPPPLPLQLQTMSTTTMSLPNPSRRSNRRVRETAQPFPAFSFPVLLFTQLKPRNKQTTNKSRIQGVDKSPHSNRMKVYDYPLVIIRELSPTQLLKKRETLLL